jgi:hypothetical protein
MAEIDQPRPASAWTSTSSPCVSIGGGSSAAVALTPSASGGAPPRVLDGPSSGPDPAAQGWGVSVISSGESPVIVNTDVRVRVPPHSNDGQHGRRLRASGEGPPDSARRPAVPHARRLLGDSSSCAGKAEWVDSSHCGGISRLSTRRILALFASTVMLLAVTAVPASAPTGPADWATISAASAPAATHPTAPWEGGRMPIV